MKTAIRVLIFVTLLVGAFQNCSDVSFSQPDLGANGKPECDNPDTEVDECDVNFEPKSISKIITVERSTKKVDILFVIDNSGSMFVQVKELANRFPSLAASLEGLDWQICVTTTAIANQEPFFGIDGALIAFPNGSKWINATTADYNQQFLNLLTGIANAKTGSGDERGIYAINRAIQRNEGCFRAGAALNTVVLSDEDERSTGGYDQYSPTGATPSSQYRELQSLDYPQSVLDTLSKSSLAGRLFTNHSMVIKPGDSACKAEQAGENHPAWYGTRYAALSASTNGILGDICSTNYSAQLNYIGQSITNSLESVALDCAPIKPSGAKVTNPNDIIDSIVPAPKAGTTKLLIGNKLSFSPALPEGTVLKLQYYCP